MKVINPRRIEEAPRTSTLGDLIELLLKRATPDQHRRVALLCAAFAGRYLGLTPRVTGRFMSGKLRVKPASRPDSVARGVIRRIRYRTSWYRRAQSNIYDLSLIFRAPERRLLQARIIAILT